MGTVIVVSLAALAALAGIVWRIDRYFNRRLDHDFQMANAQQEVDLQNARAQAEQRMGEDQLNTGTLTSQITANNAALLLKAAQDKVAVQVAEAMVPDRIEGERQALTAYNEGRTASMRTRGEHDGLEGPAQVAVTTANGHLLEICGCRDFHRRSRQPARGRIYKNEGLEAARGCTHLS
jgi:hypothetical protein